MLFRNCSRPLLAAAAVLSAACSVESASGTDASHWLADRAARERTLAAKSSTFSGFTFSERLKESGITFVNKIVDDAGRSYKAVHYDHGMGLCGADIDNDGNPDLFFVSQLGTSELWRGLGGGKFMNITDAAGLRMDDAIAVGCAFADIDNDGLPDLFVTTVRHGNRLFKNLGGGKFVDITKEAGVGYVGHSSGAVFFDYDNDGLVDLFVANVGNYTTDSVGAGGYFVGRTDAFQGHLHSDRSEQSILYHNVGRGKFVDVTKQTGLVNDGWSGDATVIDVNGDGFPDLYVLNMQGQNHLWLNEGGKKFRDATAEWFPRTPWGAMGVKAFDANGDGKLDLYVTDMHSDMFGDVSPLDWLAETQKSSAQQIPDAFVPDGKDKHVFGNALFVRRAGGKPGYDEVSDSLGVETYWPWGPTIGDVNADGWDDIFVTGGMNFPFRYSPNSLLLNQAGKSFLPAAFTTGIEPRPGAAVEQEWFRLDCSTTGADHGSPACARCEKPGTVTLGCYAGSNHTFVVMGSLGTRSSILVDIDGDGDLDLVTNEFNAAPQVLLNNLHAVRTVHALQVRLRGTVANRSGIGALVTVTTPDGRRQVKAMDGKSGYLSQSDLPLYFGLGDADHANTVEVRWPGGKVQTLKGPVASGRVEIVEER